MNSGNPEPGHKDPTPQEKQPWQELWVRSAAVLAQTKHAVRNCSQEAKRALSSYKQLGFVLEFIPILFFNTIVCFIR